MLANRIGRGGTIGIFCPSHVADMERYAPGIAAIERLGFKVKLGANMLKIRTDTRPARKNAPKISMR